MTSILAQIAQTLEANPFLAYGPMGLVLAWFMLRAEKGFAKIGELAHRIDGLTKALLVDMIDRDNAGPHVKDYAQKTIAAIDARAAKEEKGP